MITAAPWTAFLALVALEMLVVLVVRLGLGVVATITHHRSTHVRLD
jgi:hypothetical protein